MEARSTPVLQHPAWLIVVWAALLGAAFVLSTFLHEDGHGLGAVLDGIHVSTGFNKVGDYGKFPDQPDFRSGAAQTGFWAGLLGPVTSWLLALGFTIGLQRFKSASWGALGVGALAVASSLVRAIPMTWVVISSLLGRPQMEDEVGWGIWYVLKYVRPDPVAGPLDFHALLQTDTRLLLSLPAFWIPPLLSLSISLACLIPAYLRESRLWQATLQRPVSGWLFGLAPIAVYAASLPLLNWLDRLIRINW